MLDGVVPAIDNERVGEPLTRVKLRFGCFGFISVEGECPLLVLELLDAETGHGEGDVRRAKQHLVEGIFVVAEIDGIAFAAAGNEHERCDENEQELGQSGLRWPAARNGFDRFGHVTSVAARGL